MCTGCGACRIHIDIDRTCIGTQCIIAVFRSLRHSNMPASNGYLATNCIGGDSIAIHRHIYITSDSDFAVFNIRQDACIIETRQNILLIDRNAPRCTVLSCDFQIAMNRNSRRHLRFLTVFSPAERLLDSDTIATITARHGNIDISIDGDLAGCIFPAIIPDRIGQGIPARISGSHDIHFVCRDRYILTISGINTYRRRYIVFRG